MQDYVFNRGICESLIIDGLDICHKVRLPKGLRSCRTVSGDCRKLLFWLMSMF
jgi:hypothetical protein